MFCDFRVLWCGRWKWLNYEFSLWKLNRAVVLWRVQERSDSQLWAVPKPRWHLQRNRCWKVGRCTTVLGCHFWVARHVEQSETNNSDCSELSSRKAFQMHKLIIHCWGKKEVGLKGREKKLVEEWGRGMEGIEESEEEKRVCFVKHGNFSHVIADSAPQPGCSWIYYFTRAWKTQQIKVWSACLLEMDIFILDFGFSSLKSAFEIVSHQTVATIWGPTNLWAHFFLKSEQLTAANLRILRFPLSAAMSSTKCKYNPQSCILISFTTSF